MRLWLDDMRPAPDGWYWAKDVETAKEVLTRGDVTHLSLDHDLGEDCATGYDLCKWMAENNVWPSEHIAIHSMNPVGRENMRAIINRYSSFTLYY